MLVCHFHLVESMYAHTYYEGREFLFGDSKQNLRRFSCSKTSQEDKNELILDK
jgi:hypothetical protein